MLLPLLPYCQRQFASLPDPKCLSIIARLPPFCNGIIRATIEKGSPIKALLAFKSLRASCTLCPDHRTLALVLKACAISSHLSNAAEAHAWIVKSGLQCHISLSSSLFHLYLSCDLSTDALPLLDDILLQNPDPFYGNQLIMSFSRKADVDNAYKVFKKMPLKDTVSWNSMITGTVRSSRPKEALSLYRRMTLLGVEPDCFSFSTILSACARIGALGFGQRVHWLMEERVADYQSNPILCSALIDMYSKCGRIDLARRIFHSVKRISISISVWNSMMTGLAIHGLGSDALQLFDTMTKEGIFPDAVTFIGILTACSHCGMVEEARFYFESMQRDFCIKPQVEHFGAVVDALARAGKLNEAYEMVNGMSIEPDAAIWRVLLASCRRHGRWDLAEIAMGQMRRCSSGDYVLLSNIYSLANQWEEAGNVWRVMKERGVRKGRALSWVEVDGCVHQFKAGDRSHRESDDIYRVLGELMRRAKAEGFMPVTHVVAKDVSEEDKEENLSSHSEKLAVAYCVMKRKAGDLEEICIFKNLQTCWDCHGWMKAVSKVLQRVIVVRDRIRFHRFEMGSCSCRDYW